MAGFCERGDEFKPSDQTHLIQNFLSFMFWHSWGAIIRESLFKHKQCLVLVLSIVIPEAVSNQNVFVHMY